MLHRDHGIHAVRLTGNWNTEEVFSRRIQIAILFYMNI